MTEDNDFISDDAQFMIDEEARLERELNAPSHADKRAVLLGLIDVAQMNPDDTPERLLQMYEEIVLEQYHYSWAKAKEVYDYMMDD